MQPEVVEEKSSGQFLRDYCISSLILSANFRFKPVMGNTYFLYVSDQGWTLSLISPDEWGQPKAGKFLGKCRLRNDMTWEMRISDLDENCRALVMARHYVDRFVDTLRGQDSISSNLPFYDSSLPYYQRLLSTALASSLKKSLPHSLDDMRSLVHPIDGNARITLNGQY